MSVSRLNVTASNGNLSRLICPAAVLAVVTLAWVNLPAALGDGTMPTKVTATDVQRFTVYHSPQTPGCTHGVGCWLMPGATLMVSFHQATGPLSGRPHAPKEILNRQSWPPQGNFAYDMTGLIQQVITLASSDGGHTWEQVSSEPWHSCMNGFNCMAEVGLPDGTVLRGAQGQYLPFYDVPQTGYVQRSTDLCQTWSSPQVFMDADRFITFPKRLRFLKDGRLVMTGGYGPRDRNSRPWTGTLTPAMWISTDQGQTWSAPIVVLPTAEEGISLTEECDFAELPDGRLLFVSRVAKSTRWQSILEPEGDTFRLVSAAQSTLPYSGHPEMLWAREGVALHLATTGIDWTADAGQTWHDLGIGGTHYYPRSVQLPGGRIFCVSHRGGDDPYGEGAPDEEIVGLTFRLQVEE